MEKAFIEMDSDKDGCVTEAEFVKACLSNRFVQAFAIPLIGGSGSFLIISYVTEMSAFTGGWVSRKLIFPLLFWNLSFLFLSLFFFFFSSFFSFFGGGLHFIIVGLKLYNISQEVLNNAGTEAD